MLSNVAQKYHSEKGHKAATWENWKRKDCRVINKGLSFHLPPCMQKIPPWHYLCHLVITLNTNSCSAMQTQSPDTKKPIPTFPEAPCHNCQKWYDILRFLPETAKCPPSEKIQINVTFSVLNNEAEVKATKTLTGCHQASSDNYMINVTWRIAMAWRDGSSHLNCYKILNIKSFTW